MGVELKRNPLLVFWLGSNPSKYSFALLQRIYARIIIFLDDMAQNLSEIIQARQTLIFL